MLLKLIEITPTSALTFRRVPMSHKRIDTYSFIPPTSLSGYLYRLLKLAEKEDLPLPKRFKTETPDIAEYYILETKCNGLLSLGAYSPSSRSFTSLRMGYQYIGKGHSMSDGLDIFDPSEEEVLNLIRKRIKERSLESEDLSTFMQEYKVSNYNKYYRRGVYKALLLGCKRPDWRVPKWSTFKKEERRQPLDWSYCIAEKYYGLLVSDDAESLDKLNAIENYGFKIGKEGFAFVSKVFGTTKLKLEKGIFKSTTLVPLSKSLRIVSCHRIERVYYFKRKTKLFVKEMFCLGGTEAEGEYLASTVGDLTINIPKELINVLGSD